jgi:hypothetical protein
LFPGKNKKTLDFPASIFMPSLHKLPGQMQKFQGLPVPEPLEKTFVGIHRRGEGVFSRRFLCNI